MAGGHIEAGPVTLPIDDEGLVVTPRMRDGASYASARRNAPGSR
ncbi:hypothetical protein ACFXAS_07560 [Streptomyces sp. NPDC059459]